MKIVLNSVTNSQNISTINSNFAKIADALNLSVLYRINPVGEPNSLTQTVDANGQDLINVGTTYTERFFINGTEVFPTSVIISNSLKIANNLSDLSNVVVARANLGLGNVNNTSDTAKPVSAAQQAALDLKANIASPTFTGSVTMPNVSGATTFTVRPLFGAATPWDSGNLSFAAPPAIGLTTPAAAQFTTVTTTGLLSAASLSVSGTITPSQTNGIVGTTTNNNANAGAVGEILNGTSTGGVLTSNVAANATSVILTAGDWDVEGLVSFVAAGSTVVSGVNSGISTSSSAFQSITAGLLNIFGFSAALGTGTTAVIPAPETRISLSATTTVYLVAQATFTVSTMTCNGFIRARRVR